MAIIPRAAAAILASSILMGNYEVQVSTHALLNRISTGPAAAAAEQQLEIRGGQDLATRQMLSEKLPLLLAPSKNITATWLFAQLSGALKLVSTIPALCELLQKNNKFMVSDLYRAAELLDDPIGAALAQIGEPAVPQVSNLLTAPDANIRIRAVRVLNKIGTNHARSAIQAASRSENDPRVRDFMLNVLKYMHSAP